MAHPTAASFHRAPASRRTVISYYLRRGREWICAPAGHDPAAVFVKGLTIESDQAMAWSCRSLDVAHERQALLRYVHGWATEICAIKCQR